MHGLFNCTYQEKRMKKTGNQTVGNNQKNKEHVKSIFNTIAPRYDFLNRTLSLRIDELWRNQFVQSIAKTKPETILDIATGTGDIAIRIAKKIAPEKIIGVDISKKMLDIAVQKAKKHQLNETIDFIIGDAENLAFENQSFDTVCSAFGVRNFEKLEQGMKEIHRVLKPGGMLAVLEFTLPENRIIKALYLLYFKRILPLIGRIVSRHKYAYTYLTQTVEQFPHNKKFIDVMQHQGFKDCKFYKKTFGIVAIYMGFKN